MTDQEMLVESVCVQLGRKASEHGIDSLTPTQRAALLPWWLKGIVDNGGFAYFFEGADLGEAGEVADALDEIGLPEAARACRQALAVFPGEPPYLSQNARIRWMEAHAETIEPVFDGLDRVIWGLAGPLYEALAQYIQASAQDFVV